MKKLLVPLAAILVLGLKCNTPTDPTASDRVVLGESFTNVFCSNCEVADAVLDSLEADRSDLVVIKYHAYFYNNNDPFAEASQVPVEVRQTYYWGSVLEGLPYVIFDGIAVYRGISEVSTWGSLVEERQKSMNPCEIEVTGWYNGAFGVGELTVVVSGDVSSNAMLRVALVESGLTFDNETFNFVLREMFPSAEGVDTDAPQTHRVEFQVDPGWNDDELDFILFVQNDNSEEVEQATKVALSSLSEPTTNFGVVHSDTIFDFAANSLFEDHISLTNTGQTQDVYKISAVDSFPAGWTSSLCQGGICFPPGTIIYDTLAAGETDTTLIAEIFTDDEDETGFTTIVIESDNDPNLVHRQRMWIIGSP
jgi:hypothetical protein